MSVWVPGLPVRGRVEVRCGRLAGAVLAFMVLAAALLLWSAGDVAHACDPVTGEGCNTTPPPSGPSSAPPASAGESPPPQTQQQPPAPPRPRGGPFVPPTSQAAPETPTTAAPTAPPTTLAPPTTAADQPSTKSESGGGGVPWQLAAAVPAVLLGAAAVGTVVVVKKKSDPLAAYTNACNDLCWLKQQEAQADAEVQAIEAQVAQVDEAWRQAREYLRSQLRADYIAHKQKRALATVGLAVATPISAISAGLGIPLSVAMYGQRSQWYGYFDPKHWNAQVNEELISAQGLIDGIRNEKQRALGSRLASAKLQQDAANGARHNAETNLVTMRAQNPDVTFPPCGCE